MKTIFFDVDDTLYDQLLPFQQAIEKNFAVPATMIEPLYLLSRRLSDDVFRLSESGEMPLQDMHIYRIQAAMEQLGLPITTAQALQFQLDYEHKQQQIQLMEGVKEGLDFCQSAGFQLGIITNGPTVHQRKKLLQLAVSNWIPENHMFISSEVGYAKPDSRIFHQAEAILHNQKGNTYFVGDSYTNDILGARQVGWNTVWMNHRGHAIPDNAACDYVVNQSYSLLEVVRQIAEH